MPTVVTAERQDTAGSEPTVEPELVRSSVVLRIDGLACPVCAHSLEHALMGVPGVDRVAVHGHDGIAQVRVSDDIVVPDARVREAVERAGFTLVESRRLRP